MDHKNHLPGFIIIAVCFQITACSPFFVRQKSGPTGVVDADDPKIQYVGRFDFSDPKKPVFDWAGVYICARFEGTSCSVRLQDRGNEYAVTVDHRAPRVLTTDSTSLFRIASGLADSVPHSVMIQKRTEALVGKGAFMGFVLDTGKTLLPPDPRPARRIEFIGNSITSGYGVEGDRPDCGFSPETENAGMSYAAMTARALNADYHLISYSGRGVVRNFGDTNTTSPDPMPELYGRTCVFDSTRLWDFSRWTPQAVVINLGTNDFSTQPYPDSIVFQNAYRELIGRVRSTYSGVTVFCVCGPMIGEPCRRYIKNVVDDDQRMKRERDVFFIDIDGNLLAEKDWGCDHHPNITGMQKMEDIIVSEIRLRMNW